MPVSDVVIVGGGIVGMATAYQLTQLDSTLQVTVLEKEPTLGRHQTGHNSGVLHSGIYYRPGSLKARNCREGNQRMQEFCRAEGIPHEICGKVIVAVDAAEQPALSQIYQRGLANGVDCSLIDQQRLRELEPHVAGVQAVHVPTTGIVDFVAVCRRLAERIEERGSRFVTGARVTAIERQANRIVVQTEAGQFECDWLINCAGLHSDRVTQLGGQRPEARIVPFRGEYFMLRPEARRLVRNLIYPVPDPNFPFLGVHFTRTIGGDIECGPNAVLALAREGYQKTSFDRQDAWEAVTFGGFWRLAARHWRMGAAELWRSMSKQAFVRALQRLLPEIRAADLVPAEAGVRAQAVGPDGSLVDDFLIQSHNQIVNVCNAPSPAATASLTIGQTIAETVLRGRA